jgi:beta-glucanase (GH16 family)
MFQTYHYREGLPYDQARNDHWTPNRGTGNNGAAPVLDYSTDYHTYGVDWQPDHLTFYIDGIASGTFPDPGTNNSNIPRTKGYVLIQQMVENDWIRATGNLLPDPETSVDTFHVDYVRVWQGADSSTISTNHSLTGQIAAQGLTAYPNPLRDRTEFRSTPGIRPRHINIFNGQGDPVRYLDSDPLVWDGTDRQGRPLAAGLYFYRAEHNGRLYNGKLILME